MFNLLLYGFNLLYNSYNLSTQGNGVVIDTPTSDFEGNAATIHTGSTFDQASFIFGIIIGIIATLVIIKLVKTFNRHSTQDKELGEVSEKKDDE